MPKVPRKKKEITSYVHGVDDSIRLNMKVRSLSNNLVEYGIKLLREHGRELDNGHIRRFWQLATENIAELVGQDFICKKCKEPKQDTRPITQRASTYTSGTKRLTDKDPMPFGKRHRGIPLKDVPLDYLEWAFEQDLSNYPELYEYIRVALHAKDSRKYGDEIPY